MKSVSIFFILLGLSLSSCVTILKAPFDSDTLGSNPLKTLPGSPSGDELTYISNIENRLEIISWDGSNSLEIANVSPVGRPSGHSTWTSFRSTNTNFTSSVTYNWSGQANFTNSGGDFIMDFMDGMGGHMVRLMLSPRGELRYTTDYVNELPIGTVSLNTKHGFTVTCNKLSRTFNIRLSQSGSSIEADNLGFLDFGQTFAVNAHPMLSFNYGSGSNPQQTYIVDDIIISRPRRRGE